MFFPTTELICGTSSTTTSLTDGDASLTLAPKDQACNGSSTLEYNGCAFVLYPGQEITAGEWRGKLAIDDAPGKTCTNIVIDNLPNSSCEIEVHPKSDFMSGVTFEAVPGTLDKVNVQVDVELYYDPNPGACGAAGTTNYNVSWELSASLTDLFVKSPAEWGAPGGPLSFDIQFGEAGNQVYGEQIGGEVYEWENFRIKLPLGLFECESASFDSPTFSEGGLSSSTLALNVEQDECWITDGIGVGSPGSVDMNGCQYVLSTGGTMAVSCPAEKMIEFEVANKNGCLYTVAPQSGIGSIEYANTGSGFSQGIEATLLNKGTKMSITRKSGKFIDCGGNNSGHVAGVVGLSAESAIGESVGLRAG